MQTNVKKVKLHGHEFESEVTVRHRTTLGRWDASLADYPHLVGEGDTEALALADLSTMLSSDPDAHDEIERKNDEAKQKALDDEKKNREETDARAEDAKRQAEEKKKDPATGDSGAPGTAHGSDKKPGEGGPKAGGPDSEDADPLHKLEMNVTGEKNPDGTDRPPPSKGSVDEWGMPAGEATEENTDTGGPSAGVTQNLDATDGASIRKG